MPPARKRSRKREAIYELLKGTKTHPGAEWIYAKLKPEIPDLSLGTVYRNLALFREEGGIICVGTVGGQERYDADVSPHSHFICRSCGCVLDVETDAQDGLDELVESELGAVVEGHSLTFTGLCPDCCE